MGSDIAIGVLVFAGKTIEEIPDALDTELPRPFEELHVLQEGAAFAHELQNGRAQVFDARLQVHHPGESELSQVLLLEVHLHFEIEVIARIALNKLGNDGVEVLHVHDVVSDMKDFAVLAGELFDLVECALRRLAAIAHGGTVEPAEGAMLLGTPPASARSLEWDDGFHV